jgi:hypothetical protein
VSVTTSFASLVVEEPLPPPDVLGPSSGGSDCVAVGVLDDPSPPVAVGSGLPVGVSVGVGPGLTVAVAFDSAAGASARGVDVGGEVSHGQ